jgi:hypothetical protein
MNVVPGLRGRAARLRNAGAANLFTAAVFCCGQLSNPGFEDGQLAPWEGPWGGGALGGEGTGQLVEAGPGNFVHSGRQSLRLTVWDDGNPSAAAWAGISQSHSCQPGQKLRAGAWIYCSSSDSPPLEGLALAQLRLEYFRDDFSQEEIPTHITLSTPFSSSAGYAPDTWHLLQVYDRAPPQAGLVKMSIMLLSQVPDGRPKVVWVDDAFVEFQSPRPQHSYYGFETAVP